MQACRSTLRVSIAPLLTSLLLALSACGGGGGDAPAGGATAALGAGSGGTGAPVGSGGTGGATDGTSQPGGGGNPNPGSPGDDTYTVTDPNTVIVELPGGGTDIVLTSVNFELPANVENMTSMEPSQAMVLVGNSLDNVIIGNPFVYERIYGQDGNDTLDGGGRSGAYIEGGNGNDRLLVSVGTLVGGAGADVFVAAGRGAHTTPEAPITIQDFNAAEGDRIEIVSSQAHSSADLWARGMLRFDAATSRLILDFDPTTTAPTSVDQVIVLEGVTEFDPAWVTFTVR